ncbi:rRNA maturation RNase YbeY [Sinomicrobium weinanense]|uniref:Endoribonuclease YbeY n=1 Tax=Sinomicrobium weinanense TaxID=2842200 RepID=A0A926JTV9_9FLAO|nr:rRNA maturation RNase YbeY [Sinomicrobium weinanense]MBC9797284.1 rRNA maturation RNase YbeY [Sinomicrobium weinanense]MBU3125417.1 rRNA maturation RNase YbeY [Sinomicrobium weinanense]
MISFHYELDFRLEDEDKYADWIERVITSEGKETGGVSYIFCDDEYLYSLNTKYLDHDTLTDIISFDYTEGKRIHGDVYISVERVRDNAGDFGVDFEEELKRVMVHGILHYCGYKDKSEEEAAGMRAKEEEKMKMFHVEHFPRLRSGTGKGEEEN